MLKIDCRCPPQGAVVFPSLAPPPPPPPPACPPLTQPSPSSPSLAPMGSPSGGKGVSQLSLPTPFSPIFVCFSAYWNLSPILLFTHQLLTSAVFALGLSFVFRGFSPRFHFCTSLLFATSPFVCHLLQTRHVDRGDPGDWGYCWAAAPQYQHITLAWTWARLGLINQLVAPLLWGCFARVSQGFLTPRYILSIALMSLCWISHENWHCLVALGGGWGVDKMNWCWTLPWTPKTNTKNGHKLWLGQWDMDKYTKLATFSFGRVWRWSTANR